MQTNYERESASAALVYQIPNRNLEDIALEVSDWIRKTWTPENVTWKREWRSGPNMENVKVELHRYSDAFDGSPTVKPQTSLLKIVFSIKSTKSYWRDWIIIKFNDDIKQTFPDLHLMDLSVEKNKR